jgi:hypothetical protein
VRPTIEFFSHDHTYRVNGRPAVSVTKVLDCLNNWDHIAAIDLEAARALGSEVHAACDLLVRGTLDMDSLDPTVRSYVLGAQRFLEETPGVTLASEARVASPRLGVAGTLDLLREHDGELCFIDWKCSAIVPTTVGAQLSAYQMLFDETFRPGKPRERCKRLCVRLGMGTYRIELKDDFRTDWATFVSCLNIYKHREAKYG